MNDSEKRRPEASKRFDRVEVAIWRQDSEPDTKRPFFTVTFSSNYRDAKGEWQRSSSFTTRDLPHLQLAVEWAMRELLLKQE